MRLFGSKVLIKKADEKSVSAGGIHIPENLRNSNTPSKGEVVAAAVAYIENGVRVELELKKGDQVLFFPGQAVEIVIEGEKLFLIHEKDVLARI